MFLELDSSEIAEKIKMEKGLIASFRYMPFTNNSSQDLFVVEPA